MLLSSDEPAFGRVAAAGPYDTMGGGGTDAKPALQPGGAGAKGGGVESAERLCPKKGGREVIPARLRL